MERSKEGSPARLPPARSQVPVEQTDRGGCQGYPREQDYERAGAGCAIRGSPFDYFTCQEERDSPGILKTCLGLILLALVAVLMMWYIEDLFR